MLRTVNYLLGCIFSALVFSNISGAYLEPPILRLSLEHEPVTFDWNNHRSGTDRFIISFLMRGLLKYDSAAKLVCDLCQTYTRSADGKILWFDLKSNEVWSDGVVLEAKHFVDSFMRFLNPSKHFNFPDDFKLIVGAMQSGPKWDPAKVGVRAVSKHKLEIILSKPLPVFPHLLTTVAAFPIRKEFFKQSSDKTAEEHAMKAVLGPYRLAAWEKGRRIVIEGNDKFLGERPVYRVEFILGSHPQHLSRFKAGKIDILSNPTTEDVLEIPGGAMQVSPYWATRALMLNAAKPVMTEKGLRKALLYALDRDALPAFLRNGERRVTGIIPPGIAGYRELPLVTTDLGRAKLERKRVSNAADGVILRLLTINTETEQRLANWLSEQFGRIQINLQTVTKDPGAYYKELEAGRFDIALVTLPLSIASPHEVFRSFQGGAASNFCKCKWENDTFDALMEQLYLLSPNQKQPLSEADLWDRLSQILEVESVALIPLTYPIHSFLLGKRVLSFSTTPFGDPDLVKIKLRR
ncbi:MAG: ABC transporter substrate-binding protein [Bdellovibrionota bacterium]